MKYLLDTHTFIWFFEDSPNLGAKARNVIRDGENEIFWSSASHWELIIKLSLQKIKLSSGWQDFVKEEKRINRILDLPVLEKHCVPLLKLPWHHKDPFDRLLIAQSMVEGMALLTIDKDIRKYNVKTMW